MTPKKGSITKKISNELKLKCIVFRKMKKEAVNAKKTLAEDTHDKGQSGAKQLKLKTRALRR